MEINPLEINRSFTDFPSLEGLKPQPQKSEFADMMDRSIQALNEKLTTSRELSDRFAAGQNVELHDVMIASQEADTSLRLAVQLRNKVLEAYREVIRMPI